MTGVQTCALPIFRYSSSRSAISCSSSTTKILVSSILYFLHVPLCISQNLTLKCNSSTVHLTGSLLPGSYFRLLFSVLHRAFVHPFPYSVPPSPQQSPYQKLKISQTFPRQNHQTPSPTGKYHCQKLQPSILPISCKNGL